jgi:predicted ATPase
MAEARRQTLLRLLDKRGVAVSEAARERIADCTDADLLDRWLDRAFTATDAADLFTED